MKKMKLMALLLCTGLVLCACGNKEAASNNSADNASVSEADAKTDENNAKEDETKEDMAETKTEVATSAENTDVENSEAMPLKDVYAEIKDNVALVSPMEPNADFIGNIIYGFNVNELEEYVFSMPEVAESAELIFICKTSSADQADSVKGALEAYKNEQAEMMKDYLPAEYDIIANSKVVIKGDYVYLVISHNAEPIIAIIEKDI